MIPMKPAFINSVFPHISETLQKVCSFLNSSYQDIFKLRQGASIGRIDYTGGFFVVEIFYISIATTKNATETK